MTLFLQYCEKEFDLEKIDMEKFQMNGELFIAVFPLIFLDIISKMISSFIILAFISSS